MRIVSLLPAATDIVAALGAGDRLVGRTHECDWPVELVHDVPVVTGTSLPERLTSREISAAVGAVDPHQGSALYQLDTAALAAAAPEVILTQDLCQVCAVSYRSVNEAVRIMELDTVVLSLEARTIAGVLESIDAVADVLGVRAAAVRLRAGLQRRLDALPGASARDRPSVLFVEWLDPLMPGGHWVPEQITLAGGRPVPLGPGEHSSPRPWAELRDLAPEVVVLGPCGFPPEQTLAELGTLTGLPGWDRLPAVERGQVWVVDGPAHFNRPGPRIVDGAEVLADILAGRPHPAAWRVTSA